MVEGWSGDQMRREIDDAARVRGRHYNEWHEALADLKRAHRDEEYLALLQECISATERESCAWAATYGPPLETSPKYTLEAAAAWRRLGRLDLEIAVLTRYLAVPGNVDAGRAVRKRLEGAQRLAELRDAS